MSTKWPIICNIPKRSLHIFEVCPFNMAVSPFSLIVLYTNISIIAFCLTIGKPAGTSEKGGRTIMVRLFL